MRESELEARFRHEVAKLGAFSEKFVSSTAGVPDRIVVAPGGIVELVELKAEGGRLRKIQEVWIEKARRRGVGVYVVKGLRGLDDYLDGLELRIAVAASGPVCPDCGSDLLCASRLCSD